MTIKQIGIDIGKMTFHVSGIDDNDWIILRKQFSRSQLMRDYFEQRRFDAHRVAFEACSGADWLAHQLVALGLAKHHGPSLSGYAAEAPGPFGRGSFLQKMHHE